MASARGSSLPYFGGSFKSIWRIRSSPSKFLSSAAMSSSMVSFFLSYTRSLMAVRESPRFAAPVINMPAVVYFAPPSCTDFPDSTQPFIAMEAKMTG